MADADTKIADLKTEPAKTEPAKPAPEPEKPVDKSEGVKNEKPLMWLDGALDSVRKEASVHDSVRVMADRLAQLFTDAAIESPDAAEKLAIDLRAREAEFADAVEANAHESYRALAPATEEDVAALEARNHAAPHNDAAAAAVDAGMDIKTANEMTKIGSNI